MASRARRGPCATPASSSDSDEPASSSTSATSRSTSHRRHAGRTASSTPCNLAATLARVRSQTAAAVRLGHRPLVVGGDCPILIGALAGCADVSGSPPGLLFVDGHEDGWPPHASTTGEAADMELGLLLGRSTDRLEPALQAQMPRLDPSNVVILGARDRVELDDAGRRVA